MKADLLTRIEKLDKKLSDRIDKLDIKVDGLDKKIDGVEQRLIKRIDKLGLQIAKLEDDAPTWEDFDKLELRVKKVEQKVAAI